MAVAEQATSHTPRTEATRVSLELTVHWTFAIPAAALEAPITLATPLAERLAAEGVQGQMARQVLVKLTPVAVAVAEQATCPRQPIRTEVMEEAESFVFDFNLSSCRLT
jgi:hypothetical protein